MDVQLPCPYPSLAATWPVVAGWTVQRLLGTGGAASVYAATRPGQAEAALKLIDPARSGAARPRLLAEARAAAAVRHPGLVPCIDVGEESGILYLVMALAPGGDGDDALSARGKGLPAAELLTIACDIAAGLGALHKAGILHRDIKPSNLLRGADGHWMLSDFGLARLDDGAPGLTRSGYTVGTPDYMPPEQARGEELDGRADLYALGSTLFHLAIGRPPHLGGTMWAVIGKVLTEPFPDPVASRPDLPPHLAAIIRKLGRKKRGERYADADQLGDDLALVAAGRAPVHTSYSSSTEMLSRPAPDLAGPEILLFDDDPLACRYYAVGMAARGLRCRAFGDVASGLAQASGCPPAAAVIDLVQTNLGVSELVRRLREIHPGLPVIVLANAFSEVQVTAARSAGADLVLAKAQTPPRALADAIAGLLTVAVPVLATLPEDPTEALEVADAALARVQVLLRRLGEEGDEEMVLAESAAAARGLSAAAGAAGVAEAANLAAATEALARLMLTTRERRTASTRSTLRLAAQALRRLLVAPACPCRPVRALAVDDEAPSRILAGQALAKVGIAHEVVASPAEALERLRAAPYDLLVTDVVMDGMSGFQLAARSRQLPGYAQLPVVFVTGLDDFPAFFASGEGTRSDLIAKPYPLIELGVKALVLLAERGR